MHFIEYIYLGFHITSYWPDNLKGVEGGFIQVKCVCVILFKTTSWEGASYKSAVCTHCTTLQIHCKQTSLSMNTYMHMEINTKINKATAEVSKCEDERGVAVVLRECRCANMEGSV